MNAKDAVDRYIQIRDARSTLRKAYDLKDAALKQAQNKLEALLLKSMDGQGAESLRTEAGTAYITLSTRAACGDWASLDDWMFDNRQVILERRVSSSAVNSILEDGGELPPGVTLNRERGVNIRRS